MSGGRAGGHRRSSFAFIDGMVTTFGELAGIHPFVLHGRGEPAVRARRRAEVGGRFEAVSLRGYGSVRPHSASRSGAHG